MDVKLILGKALFFGVASLLLWLGLTVAHALQAAIQGRSKTTPPQADPATFMAQFATIAVLRVHRETGIELDYSVESLRVIDDQLAALAARGGDVDPSLDLGMGVLAYAAYIGEVLRIHHQWTWALEGSAGNAAGHCLKRGGVTIFPMSWCLKRMAHGESDAIWSKARIVSEMAGSIPF